MHGGINTDTLVAPGVMRAPGERLHFLDAARAIMLLLGIPMHVAEVYRLSGGWTYESPDRTFAASLLTGLIHSFRMPGFFIISGFFAAMIIRSKGTSTWIRQRWLRLGVPLLAATLLIAPPEATITRHFADNMQWSDAALYLQNIGLNSLIGTRWFIVVLLLFCATHYGLRAILPSPLAGRVGDRIADLNWNSLRTTAILFAFLMVLSFGAIALGKIVGDGLLGSPTAKAYVIYYTKYIAFFYIGILIFETRTMQDFSRPSGVHIGAAAVLLSLYLLSYFAFYRPDAGFETARKAIFLAVELPAGYAISRVLFAFLASSFQDRNSVISYLVAGSLIIYLVHMVFLDWICGYLLRVSFHPLAEIVLACSFTLLASLASFEIIRRSKVMSLMFNGGPVKI